MNVIELLAKQTFIYDQRHYDFSFNDERHIEKLIESLLSLYYPCTNDECQHGKVPFIEWDDDGKEIKGYDTCPVCHGTGLSDKKILAVLDENQNFAQRIPFPSDQFMQSAYQEGKIDLVKEGWKKTI
jgi:hypothetical protein